MTMFSRALNRSVFDGNTFLPKVGEENGTHKCVYFEGDMVCSFMTSDNIHDYISNMGKNLCAYSVATGEENYSLLAPNFKIIEKNKIDYDTKMNGIYPCEGNILKNWNYIKFIQIIIINFRIASCQIVFLL